MSESTDPLIDVFAEVLNIDASRLTDDSSPDDTPEWDSLAAMNLVSSIEEEFDIELSTTEIMKMRTVGIVRSVLKEKGVAGL